MNYMTLPRFVRHLPGIRRRRPPRGLATVQALLRRGDLRPDDVLRCSRGGRTGHGVVLTNGQIEVGQSPYDTPSSAARAALGARSVNGWTAWVVVRLGVTLATLRDDAGLGDPRHP